VHILNLVAVGILFGPNLGLKINVIVIELKLDSFEFDW